MIESFHIENKSLLNNIISNQRNASGKPVKMYLMGKAYRIFTVL